jgi:predicted ArsR family transcriptional regulator
MSKIRQVVLEILSQQGPLPLDAIARATRRTVLSLRYHLTYLEREQLIVQQDVERRGHVGRPQTLYALADKAHEHLPKQYNALAAQLLDEISDALGEKETRGLLRRAGRRIAASAPPVRAGASVETRLNRTVKFMSERGYMARWEKTNSDFLLTVCNCPYRQVAQAHRQVCDMDHAMIATLVDTTPRAQSCIANHDAQCQFLIAKKK